MKILGIETSCDETAAAVVKNGTNVLVSIVASSETMHKKFGGIIPEYAAREQIKCIMPVIQESINESKTKISNLDAIAVTYGPGLIGSLLIGIETAKTLSYTWQKPIIPINHLIAHLYANFLQHPVSGIQQPVQFPALALVVSGGHTELLVMKEHGQYKWIGGTKDDAAGECFDKTARLLGFSYPGGPEIESTACKFQQSATNHLKIKLPRPMINDLSFNFSFSGLKTAVLNLLKTNKDLKQKKYHPLLAYEIQEAITDVLVKKTIKAAIKYKLKSVLVGGGVAANQRLREKFKKDVKKLINWKVKLHFPEKKWCTDNAATIATAAYFNRNYIPWSKLKPNPSLKIC